jgi:3-oxoadipate enol-lactonase
MRMPYADVNGIKLYYEEHGNGTPLLLIMGFTANATAWEALIPYLARQHRTIAFDNRGSGRSDQPEGAYTMAQLADDAVGLLDVLGIQRAHVHGVSMGGMIAQHVYLRHPDRVLSLILGCTTPGGPNSVQASPEVVQTLLASTQMTPEQAFEANLPILYSDNFAATHRQVLWERTQQYAHLRATPQGVQGQLQAILGHDTYDRLPEFRVPTLVLHGDDDQLVPTANGRILAERIPGAKLVLYPGARHGYFGEYLDAVARDILNFTAEVDVRNATPA